MSTQSEQLKARTMQFALDVSLRKPLGSQKEGDRLHNESIELRAIFGRSLGTARANNKMSKSMNK
jgi:hypothetical protein